MKHAFFWLCRLIVGVLFILSGLIKLNDILGFQYKIEEYLEVFQSASGWNFAFFHPIVLPIAEGLALLEALLGWMLLLGIRRRLTLSWLLVLIIFFTILTGYSAITGAVTDCGCFGEVLKLKPWQSFAKDLVLLLLILFLISYNHQLHKLIVHRVASNSILLFLVAALGFFAWYTYHHLPAVDFTAYRVGSDLNYATTHVNEDGEYLAKDYVGFETACGVDELKGATLLIIMYNLDAADVKDIAYAAQLAATLKGTPVKVLGATATGAERRSELKNNYHLSYCLAPEDQTLLKTMVRANPGYILLENGVVMAKWHHNDAPTRAQVLREIFGVY